LAHDDSHSVNDGLGSSAQGFSRRGLIGTGAPVAGALALASLARPDTAVASHAGLEVNVKEPPFSAAGDGTGDDTPAVQSAIDHLRDAGGGRLYFPDGEYVCNSQLNMDEALGVVWVGTGALGRNNEPFPPCRIVYTGGGTDPFLLAGSIVGCGFYGLSIRYTNASFTGTFLDFGESDDHGGSSSRDAGETFFEHCDIGGQGVETADVLIDLEHSIIFSIRNTRIHGAIKGIKGAPGFSNAIQIEGCTFWPDLTFPIYNPGQAWTVSGCTFTATETRPPAGMYQDAGQAWGLTWIGNWHGDAKGPGGQAWIEQASSRVPGRGWTIVGNRFRGPPVDQASLAIAGLRGGLIAGNRFEGRRGIEFRRVVHGITIVGNDFSLVDPVDGGAAIIGMDKLRRSFIAGNDAPRHPTIDDKTLMVGGESTALGISGQAAPPASNLGSVVRTLPLYDINGSVIGYVPIYDSIT
jgi:hypothetical protein